MRGQFLNHKIRMFFYPEYFLKRKVTFCEVLVFYSFKACAETPVLLGYRLIHGKIESYNCVKNLFPFSFLINW